MANDTQTIRKNANENYAQFNGTDHYYRHSLGLKYTDGVGQVAEDYGAYWFIDIIASYQFKKLKEQGFQVWKLERQEDYKFKVTCDDGDKNILVAQKMMN